MANLILLKGGHEQVNMNEVEVHPEEKIEKIIFENNILPDVLLLKRQLQTYTKEGRIDIVGLDKDNNILVVEIKDEMVDENVIAQVLRYGIWIETYPDAIKSIWLENRDRLDDINFDWDNAKIKIVIIGPSFKPSVQKLINRITYPVELIEFKKFNDDDNQYIFINNVLVEEEKIVKPVDTTFVYDKQFYLDNYDPETAEKVWDLCDRIEKFIDKKGWNLTRNNTKGYIVFKYGFPNVFSVNFMGSKKIGLWFKIPKKIAYETEIDGIHMVKYEDQWKQAGFELRSNDFDVSKLEKLIEASYKNITGD
ncbi:hypothetical protein BK007_03915 [Methanobacterium subterraneum]|uniref:DUF91 domain-containing protein n=1 Tax=Methanobacterium subterraneum TaxID=59277 RepID=A0A2H4VAX9_9EURY|nr:hypothetical protein [Methanobacterium subterraneum]AUB55243.1 hypothetical protein BK007_03915 [Methanobacterium subterraneum]